MSASVRGPCVRVAARCPIHHPPPPKIAQHPQHQASNAQSSTPPKTMPAATASHRPRQIFFWSDPGVARGAHAEQIRVPNGPNGLPSPQPAEPPRGPEAGPGARRSASKGGQRKPIYSVVAGHDCARLLRRRALANATPAQGPEGPPRDTAARHPAHFAAGLRPWPRHEQEGFSSRPEPAPEGAAKEAHVWRLTHGQSPDNRQGPPGSAETQRPAGSPGNTPPPQAGTGATISPWRGRPP